MSTSQLPRSLAERDADVASARVLIVDDEEGVARVLHRLMLRDGHIAVTAADSAAARAALEDDDFDLMLVDMNLPGDSGLQLMQEVQATRPDIAMIMITGEDSVRLAKMAIDAGAYGYIIKPFEVNEVTIGVLNALRRRELEIQNRRRADDLEAAVKARTSDLWKAVQDLEWAQQELVNAQTQTIERLALAAEFRDDETGKHIERMSRYCELLWRLRGEDSGRAAMIRVASVMHDVGKIGIPDAILLKPGKLTPDERKIMETHTEIGHGILSGSGSPLLDTAARIALTHHERFDGTGYPNRLVGVEIPIEGRIAAVADVFDALTTDRVYRKAFKLTDALRFMRDGRGSHFDPDIADLFFDNLAAFLDVLQLANDTGD